MSFYIKNRVSNVDVQNLSTYTKGPRFVLEVGSFTINSYAKNEKARRM